MRINRKTDYGMRIMTFIARNMPDSTSAATVSNEMNVPYKFAEAILNTLKKEGLVNSTRGKYGGYRLPVSAEEITMLEILEAFEGEVCFLPCVNDECACEFSEKCGPHLVWTRAQESFKQTLRATTLSELVGMAACPPHLYQGIEDDED